MSERPETGTDAVDARSPAELSAAEAPEGGPPELSVLVVSYNTRALTLECLRSVFAETAAARFEVIVVDNASTDGSAEAIRQGFPAARLLALDENLGFAGANNLAAREARGDVLVLLNPDTVVLDGALVRLLRFLEERPDAGAVGGRTLFADGSLNPTSCWRRPTLWSLFCRASGLRPLFPGTRLFDPEAIPGWERDTRREVDVITGCLLALRRELWEELGGFDLRFFMYAEDADLSYRIRATGRSLWIEPAATIIHHGGASERVRADKMVRLFSAVCQLHRKHWSRGRARVGALLYDLWAATRAIAYSAAALLSSRYRTQRDTWREIWRRRATWHRDPEPPATARSGG